MKRVALASIFSLFLGTQLNAQEIKKQERPLDKFTTISLSNEDQVILKQSNQTQLTISYANGNPNDITSEVKTGVLSFKKRKGNDLKGVKLLIESPQFKNIILSGASDVKSDSVIKTDSLWITVSGAGDLRLNINANYIESTISGAGDVELSGKTDIHRTTVSGAGDLRAINLVTKTTHATITRSGDAKVNATDKLTANITGAGGIFYKNEPLEKDIDVSAAGTARKLNGNAPTKDSTKIKLGDTQIIVVPREES
ncbi:MAG: DUF2807 domain-containing protein, partial [Bacteroidia bacterium]|nr:DUF2807 domain-containing protein [Bacteroidia bacterium]